MSAVFIFVVGGGMELGFYYWQANSVQQAARTGARIAATQDPVAGELSSKTWLDGVRRTGDPLPDYLYVCDGATASCNAGTYRESAMAALIHGPDGFDPDAAACVETANRKAQGMCDFIPDLSAANVEVRYQGSGLGTAGSPADPQPLVTVTIKDLPREVLFLERLFGDSITLKPVSVTVMAEDLRGAS